ncbi:hypothetical protein ACQP2Y_04350 [Actinoplanes sp. CA-051413]|uniref:hypothetical protein n=1 Tax=Actinoplanes sp. CA-051413 TaxID=3239899 RepID=UPI003D98614F
MEVLIGRVVAIRCLGDVMCRADAPIRRLGLDEELVRKPRFSLPASTMQKTNRQATLRLDPRIEGEYVTIAAREGYNTVSSREQLTRRKILQVWQWGKKFACQEIWRAGIGAEVLPIRDECVSCGVDAPMTSCHSFRLE